MINISVIDFQGPVLTYQLVAVNKQMTIYEVRGNVHEWSWLDSRGELSTTPYINRCAVITLLYIMDF